MSSVQKLKELGISDEEIRNTFWEDNSQELSKLKELGISDEEIRNTIMETTGAEEANFLYGNTEEQQFFDSQEEKETKALDLSFEQNKKLLNENDVDEDVKKIQITKLEAQYEAKKNEIKNNSIQRNKPTPDEQTKDKSKGFGEYGFDLYKNLKEFESAIVEPFNPTIDLALHWAKKTGSAIGETAESGVNRLFGTDFDYYRKNGEALRQEGARLNKTIDPNDKLLLEPTQMTDLVAGIVFPLKVTDPSKMLMLEGMLGYTTEFADTSDFYKSVGSGAIQASMAGSGQILINKFVQLVNKQGTSKALDYLWDKHEDQLREASGIMSGSKDEVINAIEKDWLDIMQGGSSNENKVRAMIDRLGETGSAYKTASQEAVDVGDEKIVRFGKSQRVGDVKTEAQNIAGTEDVSYALGKEVGIGNKEARFIAKDIVDSLSDETTSQAVKDRANQIFSKRLAKGDIASTYGDMSKALSSKYNDVYNVDGNIISNMKDSLDSTMARGGTLTKTESNMAEILDEPMTMSNVLKIKREVTKLIEKSSGTQETNAIKLRGAVDKVLKNTLAESDYKLFKDMDIEYTNRMSIVGKKDKNKLGAKLLEFANGRKTLDSVLADLDKINVGEFSFKELEEIVGSKNIAKLEAGIVNNMLNKNIDDVSWGVISKSLNKIGFVSKEGKELKKIIDKFDTVFSADNFKIIIDPKFEKEKDVVALTADLVAKMKYTASSMIFKKIKSKFMRSKEYDNIRAVREIGDILAGEKVYVRGVEIPKAEVENIARESIKTAYKEQIKAIGEEGRVTEKQIDKIVDDGMANLGLSSNYGGKATAPKSKTDSKYTSVSESLQLKKNKQQTYKKTDSSLGLGKYYNGKATGTGGVNDEASKETLSMFLDDIANPKIEVKTDMVNDIINMLKEDSKLEYAFSSEKKRALNKLRATMAGLSKMKTVNSSQRKQVAKAMEDYLNAK